MSRDGLADKFFAGTKPAVICCKQTLVNPKLDTVYLPGRPSTSLFLDEWLARKLDFSAVRSLAVDVGFSDRWATGADEGLRVAEIVRRLGHVRKLCLISDYSANFLPYRGAGLESWQGYEKDLFNEMEGDWEGGWRWVVPKQENMIWGLNAATERRVEEVRLKLARERRKFRQGWEDPEEVVKFVKYVRPVKPENPNSVTPDKNEVQVATRAETTQEKECTWQVSTFVEPPSQSPSVWSRFQKFVTRKKEVKPTFGLMKERPQSSSTRRVRFADTVRISSVG
jgi:hypothetical protein